MSILQINLGTPTIPHWGTPMGYPTFSGDPASVIAHIILTGCVKTSVESVEEPLVSRYENHFTSSRQLDEDNALDEMIISENGPALHYADDLLDRATNRYWAENSENGKWHFIQESNKIRSYLGGSSKVNEK